MPSRKLTEKELQDKQVNKRVKDFMKVVKDFLASKNGGEVAREWQLSLDMLEVYYRQFWQLTYEIDSLDSLIETTRYGKAPSALLSARDKTAVRLDSLMKSLGLTLKSALTMEIVEPVAEESVLDKFLKDKIEKRG